MCGSVAFYAFVCLTGLRRKEHAVARRLCEQKCDGACVAETMFNDTIKDTLGRAEALEGHEKTVTMRAGSLATTHADFFKTLVDRLEEAQNRLNELSAHLSTVAPAATHAPAACIATENFSGDVVLVAPYSHPYRTVRCRDFFKSSDSLRELLSQRWFFWKECWRGRYGRYCGLHMCVPEILQMRVTAQAWNDACM